MNAPPRSSLSAEFPIISHVSTVMLLVVMMMVVVVVMMVMSMRDNNYSDVSLALQGTQCQNSF